MLPIASNLRATGGQLVAFYTPPRPGGTSYYGASSLQFFAQQPFAEIPCKYVKHIETSKCLKQHIWAKCMHTNLTRLYSFLFIHILHLEFSSEIGHPFENARLWAQRCKTLFNSSRRGLGQDKVNKLDEFIQFVHLVLPKLSHNPTTHKGLWGWLMAVIDDIKKSKDKLAFYQTVFPACSLSQVKNGQHQQQACDV